MEKYLDILMNTIIIIAKTNLVFLIVLIIGLIISFILKKYFNVKYLQGIIIAGMVVVILGSAFLLIPRIIDYQRQSFIIVENAELIINETNSVFEDGSVMFYGMGSIIDENNKDNLVLGVNFFDLSNYDSNNTYKGTIVYAQHSRQLISYQE